jgi:hypothetical protein
VRYTYASEGRERWDSDNDEHIGGGMNALNYSPFACISEWCDERLGGIDVEFDDEAYDVSVATLVRRRPLVGRGLGRDAAGHGRIRG